MFRNPRENAVLGPANAQMPSRGRPPTPPPSATKASPNFSAQVAPAKTRSPMRKSSLPSRQSAAKTPTSKKTFSRPNQSILRFFEKSDKNPEHEADAKASAPLFFNDGHRSVKQPDIVGEQTRFNEDEVPVKRRRTDDEDLDFMIRTPSPEREPLSDADRPRKESEPGPGKQEKPVHKYKAGFLDSSSDEEDSDWTAAINQTADDLDVPDEVGQTGLDDSDNMEIETGSGSTVLPLRPPESGTDTAQTPVRHGHAELSTGRVPHLKREATSRPDIDDFDGDYDFEDDEFFEGGEEYMERRWMEEQREMEMGLDDDSKSESGVESVRTPHSYAEEDVESDEPETSDGFSVCPICTGSMRGLSETEASTHVNACLDGNAEPLPKESEQKSKPPIRQSNGPPSATGNALDGSGVPATKRFQRAAIARPAQSNPFTINKEAKGGSAFARLMSGHAEDAAWAEAASNEASSRGKQAYQRTCPFYKIMPGFYICVDAFRYGKVEGQQAYFLSHFHSDHYIGLTSSWAHGPIYASKVTCNLMLQQLRVDPKWVVPLEFEKRTEVPNTKGVFVTMIPANHCPGSSLYLFEKVVGKNRDGSPRSTRILHCGDFRACPAHISHPLLRPDVIDSITGQTKQQVIDTCYLDTTYLTPKYSFPSQHDVIDACAQMCVSLSKEIVDTGDSWETAKAERAGSTMKKFLEQGESTIIKDEAQVDSKPKTRGRLLVVIGTYSIGKERICLGIAKALNSKIYAPPAKMRICLCLEDPELNARLTKNPLEAQVHMQTLMEIRADTLHDYMATYKGHFARVVGFRPTGWNYRPPTSRSTENPAVNTVLHSEGWKTRYSMRDLAPQRGSTRESNCFGVPYSEHSSFRELTMFVCALRINRVVPTVNVGNARTREKMKAWIDKWEAEKRKNGLFKVEVGNDGWGSGDGQLRYGV